MVGFGKDKSGIYAKFRFLSYISENRIKDILDSLSAKEAEARTDSKRTTYQKARAIIGILNETGCDVKELNALKVKDILAHTTTGIFSEKSNTIYSIRFSDGIEAPISENTLSGIKRIVSKNKLSSEDYLISKKKPYSTKRIEQILSEASASIGFAGIISPKKLKDSYAIRTIETAKSKKDNILVPLRKDLIEKARLQGDRRLELIINLLADGYSIDEIRKIEIGIYESIKQSQENYKTHISGHDIPGQEIYHTLKKEYETLCQEIIGEQRHRSRFLFCSRNSSLSRRRIEQLLSSIGCTSKDVERIHVLDMLLEKVLAKTSDEERALYERLIGQKMLYLRHSGSLEVYRW